MLAKISDLREREIVNVLDGKRLGPIKDIDIDIESGKITSLILPGPGRIFRFLGRNDDYIVPWEKVVRIGVDVILVEAQNFTDLYHDQKGLKSFE
ncbi:sporulation protein, YlmC/YmxH family [Desulfonispora thiosulfatigenes DSM 11270]|uniref:Sporulation protein, YlmC/YmxH family n=1 Tax=Desulfonispora thiosulfatigenes DSM 11270 TaxID=656914 RepID=A0A1W1VSP9_DESTI|nr:YlmC/YmxH family sporulation protein [Desulfonispora thiosulfatigenes]SMB96402.1 sporulation protein, YlmC/YmxH family [Desulfonispora thiosulfatigenes DSM 11270]